MTRAALRIKVCGFTSREDVLAAAACGVDAYGFNFAAGPRRIAVAYGRELAAAVPALALRVALFLDADYEQIAASMQASGCQAVQLHGREPAELAARLRQNWPVIKAFHIATTADLEAIGDYPADAYLLDAKVAGQAGGTGQGWDYAILAGVELPAPVIIAGGLRPENVDAALGALAALQVPIVAVDTASGVESAPGRKDGERLRRFVAAARGSLTAQ